ncbi:hypothetical protein CQ10_41705 [Bradyrhizobium valentinum]|nr:hypothetical protein CQ10_41705 [Bradyrhizobium valentinum]
MRFRFIEDRRADYPVTILCDVLAVSPAGYYAWRSRPESQRSAANRKLVDDIKQVHSDTRGRYGSPRIHAELKAQGRGVTPVDPMARYRFRKQNCANPYDQERSSTMYSAHPVALETLQKTTQRGEKVFPLHKRGTIGLGAVASKVWLT